MSLPSRIKLVIDGVEYDIIKSVVDKTCSRCKVAKPLHDFSDNSAKKDGKCNFCKPCASEAAKQHYHKKKALKEASTGAAAAAAAASAAASTPEIAQATNSSNSEDPE